MAIGAVQDIKSLVVDITGAAAGGVATVTGAAPITSTGGANPQIGMTTPLAVAFGGSGTTIQPVLVDGSQPLTANWNASNSTATPERIDAQNSTRWFNIVAYGADPTGAADSTAAVQAAVNAATAVPTTSSGTVYVPSGQYKLVSTVTITAAITMRGDGPLASVFMGPTGSDSFVITTIASTQRPVCFFDLQFNINGVATAGAQIHSNATGNFPLIVRNCNFYLHFVAIQMNTNWASYISENQFLSAVATSTDILIDNTINQDQGDNQIFENTFWSNGAKNIRQRAGGGTRILGNKFVGPAAYSIYLDTQAGKTTGVMLIIGNSLEGGVTSGNIAIVPDGTFSNIVIQDNEFQGTPGTSSIYLGPTATGLCPRGQITGNTFYNCATHIQLNPGQAGGVDKWNIANNVFDSPTNAAIWLQAAAANVTNFTVGRNNFIQSGAAPYVLGAFSASGRLDPGIETVFSQTANSTTTANSLTTVLGTGNGSLTIPAGRLMVGTRVRIQASGFQGTADGGAAAHIFTFSLGGVTVATVTTGAVTGTLNSFWVLDATLTVRTTGAGGTVIGKSFFNMPGIYNAIAVGTGTAAANTPTALTLDVKMNNQNATGSLTTTEATVELLD